MNKQMIGLMLALGAFKVVSEFMDENKNENSLEKRLKDIILNVSHEDKNIRNQAKVELVEFAKEIRNMVNEKSIDYMFLTAMITKKSFSKTYLLELVQKLDQEKKEKSEDLQKNHIENILEEIETLDQEILNLKKERSEYVAAINDIDQSISEINQRKRELFDMIGSLRDRA